MIIRNESRNAQTGVVTAQVIDTVASTLTPETDGVPGVTRPLTPDEVAIYITNPAQQANKSAIETNLAQDLDAMQAIIDTANVSFTTIGQAQTAMRDVQRQLKDVARNLRRLDRMALEDFTGST